MKYANLPYVISLQSPYCTSIQFGETTTVLTFLTFYLSKSKNYVGSKPEFSKLNWRFHTFKKSRFEKMSIYPYVCAHEYYLGVFVRTNFQLPAIVGNNLETIYN